MGMSKNYLVEINDGGAGRTLKEILGVCRILFCSKGGDQSGLPQHWVGRRTSAVPHAVPCTAHASSASMLIQTSDPSSHPQAL